MRQHQHSSSQMGMTDWVSNSLRDRPEAFLLMAAGVALMMTNTRIGLADRFMEPRRSSSSGSDWRSREPSVTDRVSESMDDLRETAGDYTQRARSYMQETSEQLTRQSGEMMDKAKTTLQENVTWMVNKRPLVLGALAFAAGAALGTLIPETDMENRTLGSARDELTEAAAKMAQDRVEALKSVAGDVGERFSQAVSGSSGQQSGGSSQQSGSSQSSSSQASSSQGSSGSSSGTSDEKSNTARSTTRS